MQEEKNVVKLEDSNVVNYKEQESEILELLDEVSKPTIPISDLKKENLLTENPKSSVLEREEPVKTIGENKNFSQDIKVGKGNEKENNYFTSQSKVEFSPRQLKKGDLVEVTVVKIEKEGIMINAGGKGDYFIPLKRLTKEKDVMPLQIAKEGEKIKVVVLKEEDESSPALLSKIKADESGFWNHVKDAYKNGIIIPGKIIRSIKGGYLVDIGLSSFLPQSQISLDSKEKFLSVADKEIKVKVIEFDPVLKRIVVSRRAAQEEEKKFERDLFLTNLKEGEILEGFVNGINDFGVFVDLGKGLEGLVPINELTYGRRKHPREVVKKGEKVKVKILKIDLALRRVSLSLKQAKPHPWENIEANYPIGSIVKGHVIRILPFGAIIEIKEGITGLLHISQLDNKRIKKVEDVLKIGDEVEVKIIDILKDERKLKLSRRAVFTQEENQEK